MKRIYIPFLSTLALILGVGCSTTDSDIDIESSSVSDGDQISFTNSLAKGEIYDSLNKELEEFTVFAYYTNDKSWAAAEITDITRFMYNQKVTKSGSDWVYTPIKYWPNGDDEHISFYAVHPIEDIEFSEDETPGKPYIYHKSTPFAVDNEEILVGTAVDKSRSDSGVYFDMKHANTRINIEAKLDNMPMVDVNGQTLKTDNLTGTGEYNVVYTVNGVIFNDVLLEGELEIDDSGDLKWNLDENSLSYVNATQGNTLMDVDDTKAALGASYSDVCADGQAIFVLPQPIETTSLSVKPTVELRIHKSFTYYNCLFQLDPSTSTYRYYDSAEDKYYDHEYDTTPYESEVIYIPSAVELPTPNGAGWLVGQNIDMRFTFDIDANNPTPLTVLSMIYEYSEIELDINMYQNIYIYASDDDVINVAAGEDQALMTFYTNYSYDLTTEHSLTQLDGSLTTSRGFMFYAFNATASAESGEAVYDIESLPTYDSATGKYTITVDDGVNASYSFTYSLVKSTRGDLGLYIGVDDTGINKSSTDSVYDLYLDIDPTHLVSCDSSGDTSNPTSDYGTFSGVIGVEMLSNAGGKITKLFPIQLVKDLR